MSKTILAKADGFTPVIDNMIKECGVISSVIFGRVWRYCQMEDGVCWASQETIAEDIGMSRHTINEHLRKLVKMGYLEITDNEPGSTVTYRDTGRAGLSIQITGGVSETHRGCELESQGGVSETHTKKVIKKEYKERIKDNTIIPEPELEPCDIDGVPDSWKDKPQRKQFISLEEKRLGDTISDLLGIKPPLLQGKKDYAASTVTWWKPIREMLRQVDGDVSKAERTVEKALDKLRGRDYVISSPQGLEKTYISCLVSIRDKGFEPTKQDSDLYDIINR